MAMLDIMQDDPRLFLREIAQRPQGRYVHYVLIRESESFPVFQTDGTLNVIRTQAGVGGGSQGNASQLISRLVIFKRKQTSPERLTGRELLRLHGIISDDGDKDTRCVYNSEDFCKHCPDCIHYGYAIGDQGAEKSKVYVDSAFSITRYEDSHKAFRFNALYESGTMTDEQGKTRSSFGEQDHVVPQVFFPAVVTLRDPTFEGFLYVLGNLLRTSRYGAQETRTGRIENHFAAITFTSGEAFSNLRFAQAMYDHVSQRSQLEHVPLDRQAVLSGAAEVVPTLLAGEPVEQFGTLTGANLTQLLDEARTLYQDSARVDSLLHALDAKTKAYAAPLVNSKR